MKKHFVLSALVLLLLAWPSFAGNPHKISDISPPAGYVRVSVVPGTFAASLRDLPLQPPAPLLAGDGKTWLCDQEKVAVTTVEPFDNKKDVGVDGIVRMWGDYL